MNNKKRGIGLWVVVLVCVFIGIIVSEGWNLLTTSDYSYSDFQQDIQTKAEQIEDVVISPNKETPTGMISVEWKNSSKEESFYVTDVNQVKEWLESVNYTDYKETDVINREGWFYNNGALLVLGGIFLWFLFSFINSQQSGGGNKMTDFGKSHAKMTKDGSHNVTFRDVAGLQEEKEDLQEIVDFLKSPEKYTKVGARIPKGVILVGPPGTGKTLLAKAVAGEAGVPFFSISGSDFVEMFVGVGASRVRDLFENAKKNAPCIVFIDEIDAVARKRGTGLGGGHDEREQTLNQLLVEMDGFGVNEGIIVMAATNRVDILDPAILRPGRFDRKVAVGRPDVKGREEILKVHTKNKPLGSDVNLRRVAQTTAGFTGADLENLMNEAAINAAKSKQGYISQRDIEQSFVKVGIGAEKHSKVISDKEKRITAYHESGHAILFHVLPHESQVHTISIIPTGMGAAGYTMPLPEADEMFMTKKRMEEDIIVAFGGRVAEELIFGDVTTGASQDIKQATATARAMVVKYGMSERLGTINYEDSGEEEVFLGRDLGHARSYSEDVAREIDIEVKRIIDEAYAQAKTIITEHMDVLHRCAQVLIEREKIGSAEFEAIFDGRELPGPGAEQTSLMSGMPSEGR